jgi:hypothetical protein
LIESIFWSHRGELCTFDVMIEEFELHSEALDRLAVIVRGADRAPGYCAAGSWPARRVSGPVADAQGRSRAA